jgi:hypothetical protein
MSLAKCEICEAVFDCAYRHLFCPHNSVELPERERSWLRRILPLTLLGLLSGCELIDSFDYTIPLVSDGGDAGDVAPDLAEVQDLSLELDATVVPDQAQLPDLEPPADLAPYLDLAPPVPVFDPAVTTGAPAVQSDIDRMGCATATCHQAYAPLLFPPSTSALLHQNYMNFLAETMGGAQSKLLTRLLITDPTTHSGGKPFISVADPTYQRWLRWIQYGTPER